MKKIISFVNQKGGVGKTTLAFNTAYALKEMGKSVLCIDLDPQANLTSLILGKIPEKSIFDLLINSQKELKSLHRPLMITDVLYQSEVDLLPANQDLSGFELTMASLSFPRPLVLKKFLETSGLIDRYDYIVIDCPPTLGLLVVNAICSSEGVIIPFKADDFSLIGVKHFYQVLEDIKDMGIGINPEVITHVPNLLDSRRKSELNSMESFKNFIENSSLKIENGFNNKSGILKAINSKKSVFHIDSKEMMPIRQEFLDVGRTIEEWSRE